ncbi:HNH endonuclease [uncultured Alistipes sp.]|jgi:hypothetical protein|uniref:HNH endonuclease n=1 Tax=uncultured Alistipes sp. TaxID=538949 RepID=UPI0025F0C505|nr:HNH endonuclease [uncultured Alistipes sp.]
MNNLGNFYSWEIVSLDVAIKHCDSSVFKYQTSGIPIQTRWFWGVQDLKYPQYREIILNYRSKEYIARIETDVKGGTSIIWRRDLHYVINNDCNISNNDFPFLRFVKSASLNTYDISFIDTSIETDDNDNLESYVTIQSGKEGKSTKRYVTTYERNPKNRADAIKIHGTTCKCCGFNFEEWYGIHGKDFIEVHHLVPLAESQREVEVNPTTDLVCLCSNCHRMIHRRRNSILTVEELSDILKKNKLT